MDIEEQGNNKKNNTQNDSKMIDENEDKKINNNNNGSMEVEKVKEQPSVQETKQESQEKQKKLLMETFKQVHERLSKGCGREKCKNETCLANPMNKYLMNDPAQAQQKAIELLKKKLAKIEVCNVVEKSIKSLQRTELQNILQSQNLEQNFKLVLSRIEEVFNDFDALNNSFFIDENSYQIIEEQNSLIDFQSINYLYHTLNAIQNEEQKKIIDDLFSASFIKVLGDIKTFSSFEQRFKTLDDFRIFGCLILYPKIFEDPSLLSKVMNLFYYLNEKQYEILGYWLKGMDSQTMERIVTNMKTQIMVNFFDEQYEVIEAVMNGLKILYTSNVILQRIERSHFMVDIFGQNSEESIHPVEEYKMWLRSKENTDKDKRIFSFCNYPFSMDIKFKYVLLEINSKYGQKLEHEKKIKNLIDQGHLFVNQSQLFLIFEVSRDNILDDTISSISIPNLNYKLPFKVKFKGEQGIDEGGVRKEYYQIMIKQLFNPDFGLFVEKQNRQFFWFNGVSIYMPMYYELIGSLMGIAIYNQIQMDVRFPNVVYKKLIGDPVSLEDIKQFDEATYNGFKHILNYDGDLENDLQLTFSIEYDSFGQTITHELKEGGDNIPVTQENKKEFIDLYVDWYLNKSIEKQFNNFKRGFFKVLNLEMIKIFTFDELVLILTGREELDFQELKENTVYDQGYSEESDQIKWLWELLEEFTIEQRKKFLFFCTGSDRAPVTGFSSLRFIISRHGEETEQLPSAHTCFNHLLIPAYTSKEILKQKLLLSLENAEGFGLY